MLTSSFCCFDGVSRSAELRLWQTGWRTWRELQVLDPGVFSRRRLEKVRAQVAQAEVALQAGLADYFLRRLGPPDRVRVLPHFLDVTGFLDIETTGLTRHDHITTIALVTATGARAFVRGRDMDTFMAQIPELKLLVTYNGSHFDIPRLRKELRIDLGIPHLDLRPCLEAHGYTGGLKRCEELLGINRPEEVRLTGGDAVELWKEYERHGSEEHLRRLVGYNIQDARSLAVVATRLYNRVMATHPERPRLRLPHQNVPQTAAREVVRMPP